MGTFTGPIPMLIFCPRCGMQHIDAPDPPRWNNPPHKTHECQGCGYLWRCCDYETTGVEAINTKGKNDRPARGTIALCRTMLQALVEHNAVNSVPDGGGGFHYPERDRLIKEAKSILED